MEKNRGKKLKHCNKLLIPPTGFPHIVAIPRTTWDWPNALGNCSNPIRLVRMMDINEMNGAKKNAEGKIKKSGTKNGI